MPVRGAIKKLLEQNYESKRILLHGRVDNVPLGDDGRGVGYVTATVRGQAGIVIAVDPDGPLLASYDDIQIEQLGNAAQAQYALVRRSSGGRPQSGLFQFMDSASNIAGSSYASGDILIGALTGGSPNTYISAGKLRMREGATDKIVLDTSTSSITVGQVATGLPNVQVLPTSVALRTNTTERIRLDNSGSGFLANNNVNWDSNGNFFIGGSARVGGWNVTASALSSGSVGVYAGAGASPAFYAGATNSTTAPFRVYSNGNLFASSACIAGQINATSGCFTGQVNATSGCFTGQINATSGCFTGQINATSGCLGQLTLTGNLQSSNFATGVSGWQISSSGNSEFQNTTIRGELRSATFVKGMIEAHAGTMEIGVSAGVLDAPYTVGSSLKLRNPPDSSWLFATGDLLHIKAEYSVGNIGDTWISASRSASTNIYTTASRSGTIGVTYPAGIPLVDWGVAGQGILRMSADLTGAPYYDVLTHNGSPWASIVTQCRLGNTGSGTYGLTAGSGSVLVDQYGINVGPGKVVLDDSGITATAGRIGGWNLTQTTVSGSPVYRISDLSASPTALLEVRGGFGYISFGDVAPVSGGTGNTGVMIHKYGVFGIQADQFNFALVNKAITHNSESLAAGAVLQGSNATGKANTLWNPATGELYFRTGQTVKSKIDTSGNLVSMSSASGYNVFATVLSTGSISLANGASSLFGGFLSSSAGAIDKLYTLYVVGTGGGYTPFVHSFDVAAFITGGYACTGGWQDQGYWDNSAFSFVSIYGLGTSAPTWDGRIKITHKLANAMTYRVTLVKVKEG
jgi:hypothetical protein